MVGLDAAVDTPGAIPVGLYVPLRSYSRTSSSLTQLLIVSSKSSGTNFVPKCMKFIRLQAFLNPYKNQSILDLFDFIETMFCHLF